MNNNYPARKQTHAVANTVSNISNTITSGDPLLTSAQVAALIGKSEAWLARKRWAGEDGIPYRKIGRHVRYQTSVVLQWLNRQPEMSSTSSHF